MNSRGEFAWRTNEEMIALASTYAARLSACGLRRGQVCILVLPSGETCASLLLATLVLGAVPLLVAPPMIQGTHSSLPRILLRTVRKTGARLVIADESLSALHTQLVRGSRATRFVFGPETLPDPEPDRVTSARPDPSDVAAMQLTSGTTGFPRVCVWSHERVLAALDGMAHAMRLSSNDICLNWTPLYHDMGLVNNFLLCLTSGVPLVMLGPTDFVKRPALWLRALHSTGATITWSPNFGFALASQRVKDHEIEGVRLDHVKAFWNAAERVHLETMRTFRDRFASHGLAPDALKTNFGCAENVGGATFSDPDGPFVWEQVDLQHLQEKRVARVVTGSGTTGCVDVVGVGRPNPGLSVKILSPRGRELPDGHVGELALHTPSRMIGYLQDQRQTRRALRGDLLLTGDLAYRRNDEVFWVGRTRERLTVRGKKFDPSDFEGVLWSVAGLRPGSFAAFGVDDQRRGTQRVVVISEVREPVERPHDEICSQIRDQVLVQLGITIDETVLVSKGTLTKTSSGKRRHRHFRRLYLSGELQPRVLWKE